MLERLRLGFEMRVGVRGSVGGRARGQGSGSGSGVGFGFGVEDGRDRGEQGEMIGW